MAKIKHLNRSLPPNASRGQKHLSKILNDIFCTNGVCMTVVYEQPLDQLASSDIIDYYKVNGMSVDFYIKELNIAIEYQGRQHYSDDIGYFKGQQNRDTRKREFLEDVGTKLVEIPYTWGDNFTAEQVRELVLGAKE
jgi:hypothetical protein